MPGDVELSGDYGYDLVHEVLAGLDLPRTPALRAVGGPVGRPFDPDGDLGYDQAHER